MMKYFVLILGLIFIHGCKNSGGTWQHYRLTAFNEARERGMTVFLHFDEKGNTQCTKQKEILEDIIAHPDFKKVGAYRVSFGAEKALQNFTGVSTPCTVVVYKGDRQWSKDSGSVDPKNLERILRSAL